VKWRIARSSEQRNCEETVKNFPSRPMSGWYETGSTARHRARYRVSVDAALLQTGAVRRGGRRQVTDPPASNTDRVTRQSNWRRTGDYRVAPKN